MPTTSQIHSETLKGKEREWEGGKERGWERERERKRKKERERERERERGRERGRGRERERGIIIFTCYSSNTLSHMYIHVHVLIGIS